MPKKPPAPRRKKPTPAPETTPPPLKVFEAKTSKGAVMLSTREEERVAYCAVDGWLLLDDAGTAVVKTRAEAEAFVAGALGLTTGPLTTVKDVAYCVVTEDELKAKASRLAKAKARADARALFADEERVEP